MNSATNQTPAGTLVSVDLGVFIASLAGVVVAARVVRHYANGKIDIELVNGGGPWRAGKNLHTRPENLKPLA